MLPPLDPAVEPIVAAMPDITLTPETLPTIRSLFAGAAVDVLDGAPPNRKDAMTESTLDGQLRALVGRPIGDGGPAHGPDPVNLPMIRHWAAAFEDANPVYTDPEAAAASRHGGIVAPPLMLQTWIMATPQIEGIGERGGSPVEGSRAQVLAVLDDAGFVGTVASNSEFEIDRYLRVGDEVSAETVLESVSPQKQTRLGAGYFVTWVTTYADAHGEVVGRQRFRVLKFRPGGGMP